MEKATRQHTKEHNRSLVLRLIFAHEVISRAEIARITHLTRTTVSDIVSDLLDQGLVQELGTGESLGGGKNPILLGLVEDSRWVIGLDLGQNEFRAAVVNLRGKIREVVSIPINDTDGIEALTLVYHMVDKLISSTTKPLSGIGVGTPGLVGSNDGMVVNAVNLNWRNVPLAKLLQEKYNLPVSIMNDSQAAALGEKTYGQGSLKEENMVLLNIHHGIGAGIFLNGQLFQGDGGFAGEIGHIVVQRENGELCRCGNYGCLETVASTRALIQKAREAVEHQAPTTLPRNPEGINLNHLLQAYRDGDSLTVRLVTENANYIGLALSGLVGMLNIHRIVLGGQMTRFGNPWLDQIRTALRKYSLERAFQETHVEIGQLGENATLLGAAAVFATNYSHLFSQK